MASLRKKAFVVALSFLLFATQSYALGLESVFNGTTANTNFGTWNSPRTGSKYFYGGSYTFAFKGAGKYQPFFQGEPPSFKVGCNGFSLSGGFIALLGIPEIKTLLKNAGATLAWGMMIALQYSMPAISSVFATLRKYARELQSILGNSCNIGKMIMTNKKLDTVMTNTTNGFTSKVDSYFTNLMGGSDGVGKMIDDFYADSENGCVGLTGEAKQTCENKKGTGSQQTIGKLSETNSLSALSLSIGAFASNAAAPLNGIGVSKLSTFLSTGKIGDTKLVSNADTLNDMKTTILVTRLFFGDMATPNKSFMDLFDLTHDTNTTVALGEGQFPFNATTIKKTNEAALSSQVKEINSGMVKIPPVISNTEDAAKALINGITLQTNASNCGDGWCSVNDNYVYFLDSSYTSDGSKKIQLLGNVWAPQTTNPENLKVYWSGAYLESLQIIRAKVVAATGYQPTFPAVGETTINTKSPSDPTIKIPLLLPNIDKYLHSIILLERRAKGETAYTAQLKSLLARYNGYFFATSLINMIAGKITDAMGNRGDPVGSPNYNNFKAYLDDLNARKIEITKQIKEEIKNQISYRDLAEMFQGIDKKIREDLIKTY